MPKTVTFYLGPADSLSGRVLTITRMRRAGDDTAPAAEVTASLAGNVTISSQILSDNIIYQATLVDTRNSGDVSVTATLNFQTGDLQFPGPASGDRISILSMQSNSSSSSSQSSSSWSSTSTSSSVSSSSESSRSVSSVSSSGKSSSSSISSSGKSSSSSSSESSSSSSSSSTSSSSSSSNSSSSSHSSSSWST